MAGSPQWKVYRNREYVAACKFAEDAAVLVSASGGVVKHDHGLIVWTEGQEEFSAGESYDGAARVMEQRRHDAALAAYEKAYGKRPSGTGSQS